MYDCPPTAKKKCLLWTSSVFVVSCRQKLCCNLMGPTNMDSSFKNMVHRRHTRGWCRNLGWSSLNNVHWMCWLWTAVHTLQVVEILACSSFCKIFFFSQQTTQMFSKQEFLPPNCKKKRKMFVRWQFSKEVKKVVVFLSFSCCHEEIHEREYENWEAVRTVATLCLVVHWNNKHDIFRSLLIKQKKIGKSRFTLDWKFCFWILTFAFRLQTLRSLLTQKEFFRKGHKTQNFVVKIIIAGEGLQQILLFQEKNKLLPVLRKKELLRFLSFFQYFLLTSFVFVPFKVIPDICWPKHKWHILVKSQQMGGMREKMVTTTEG